ncbi:hypothetical protein ONS96_005284 [Cadophora gregata f. sp. sojae]|nr:hypothetical protein ONS96_005284 [Cadophora gregata f. sp. sojae]
MSLPSSGDDFEHAESMAEGEEDYGVDPAWARRHFKEMASAKQLSIHKGQLNGVAVTVNRIDVTEPNGSVYRIQPSQGEQRLKMAFTGGTDFPTIELRLRIGYRSPGRASYLHPTIPDSTPPSDTKLFLYYAVDHDRFSDPSFAKDRIVVPIQPGLPTFGPTDRAPLGPTTFTRSMKDLTMVVNYESKEASVSWRFSDFVEYGMGIEDFIDHDMEEGLIENFNRLREMVRDPNGDPDGYKSVVVHFKWNPSLEHGYRHLLSIPKNVTCYWRWAVNAGSTMGTVPANLAEDHLWLEDEEVHIVEVKRLPTDKLSLRPGIPMYEQGDIKIEYVALPCKTQFSVSMEFEVFLKVPLLYERAAMQQTRQYDLDGYWPWAAKTLAELGIVKPHPYKLVFLLRVNMAEGKRVTLPDSGTMATVIWNPRDIGVKSFRWKAKVIPPPPGELGRFNCALLATRSLQSASHTDLQHKGWKPYFVLSEEETSVIPMFESLDRMIYGNSMVGVTYQNWLKVFLMARRNWLVRRILPFDVEKLVRQKLLKNLNREQRFGAYTIVRSPLSIVIGPPGTGKTVTAATAGILEVSQGGRVIVMSEKNGATKANLQKHIQLLRYYGASDEVLATVTWYRAASFADENDADMVAYIFEDPNDPLDHKGTVPSRWASSAIRATMHADESTDRYTVRRQVLDAVKAARASGFVPSDDRLGAYEASVLKALFESVEKVRGYQTGTNMANTLTANGAANAVPSNKTLVPAKLVKEVENRYESCVEFFVTYKTKFLFTTLAKSTDDVLKRFGPSMAIIDEAASTPEILVDAGLATFVNTLKKVALVGDNNQLQPHIFSYNRNHLRMQLSLDMISRLETTGIKPVRLITQYRMHPDISDVVVKKVYTKDRQVLLKNGPSTASQPGAVFCRDLVTRMLNGIACNSIMVNIKGGVCMSRTGSSSLVNFQEIVVMEKVLRRILDGGIGPEKILILFFYAEAVRVMKHFLARAGIRGVGVQMVSSVEVSQGQEREVTLVGVCKDGHAGERLGFLSSLERTNVAMTRAKVLRIVFCNQGMGRFEAGSVGGGRGGVCLWRYYIESHMERRWVLEEDGSDIWETHGYLLPPKDEYEIAGGDL